MLTAAGLKPANQLKKGDTIFDAREIPTPSRSWKHSRSRRGSESSMSIWTWRPPMPDERLIISDGIITGDIVLQGLLKETEIDLNRASRQPAWLLAPRIVSASSAPLLHPLSATPSDPSPVFESASLTFASTSKLGVPCHRKTHENVEGLSCKSIEIRKFITTPPASLEKRRFAEAAKPPPGEKTYDGQFERIGNIAARIAATAPARCLHSLGL